MAETVMIEMNNEMIHNALNTYIKEKLVPDSKLVKYSITNLRGNNKHGYKAKAEVQFNTDEGEK
jgi:hypothetical protein